MIYKAQIHKRIIYLKPRPKKDIPGGLIIMFNKSRDERSEPLLFASADIYAGQKEYTLPELPKGIWVIKVFVKENGAKNKD